MPTGCGPTNCWPGCGNADEPGPGRDGSGGEAGLEGARDLDDALGLVTGGVAGLVADGVVALGVDVRGAVGVAVDELDRVGVTGETTRPPKWWIELYSASRVDSWPPWAVAVVTKPL